MDAMTYRQKHHRCRYCKYCYIKKIPHHLTASIAFKCKVKDKILDFDCLWNGRGIFCQVFVPEEIEE